MKILTAMLSLLFASSVFAILPPTCCPGPCCPGPMTKNASVLIHDKAAVLDSVIENVMKMSVANNKSQVTIKQSNIS